MRIRHAFVIGLIAVVRPARLSSARAATSSFVSVAAPGFDAMPPYPASVLIYRPAHATPAGIREFEAILKQVGTGQLS